MRERKLFPKSLPFLCILTIIFGSAYSAIAESGAVDPSLKGALMLIYPIFTNWINI